jgi:hypothetical protein
MQEEMTLLGLTLSQEKELYGRRRTVRQIGKPDDSKCK